ncbi:MBL fold metallo-hydrolase [Flavihumibacter petaseus]|nr:MBL fold metallo-hydrolase [Flavihumibacter petaseus]
MLRRKFIQQGSALAAGALLIPRAFSKPLYQDPWTISMLNKTTGVFTEKGGTILFQVAKDNIIVVDTEFPEQADHLITVIKGKSSRPVSVLINTHHHGDHTSGNISFKSMADQVVAHANSLKNQRTVAIRQKTEDKQYFPNSTFTEKWSGKFGRETVSMHYFGPAHTDGDSLVYFETSGIVHMGDLINNRRYPYIDRTAGASIKGWISVLNKTLTTFDDKTTFVFGHATEGFPVYGKKEAIVAMKSYFERLLEFTGKEIQSGITKEAFLKNTSIPGVTEWVGDGIERSLTAAWEELTESKQS